MQASELFIGARSPPLPLVSFSGTSPRPNAKALVLSGQGETSPTLRPPFVRLPFLPDLLDREVPLWALVLPRLTRPLLFGKGAKKVLSA